MMQRARRADKLGWMDTLELATYMYVLLARAGRVG